MWFAARHPSPAHDRNKAICEWFGSLSSVMIRSMETIDTLYSETLKLVQSQNGYRFSLDPVLLADFVSVTSCRKALDLGCGCGVLGLLLARKAAVLSVVGWERQLQMVARARRSVELSGMSERVRVFAGDLREYRRLADPGVFDLVVTNPPYRGLDSGRIAPDDERAAARHELAGGLEDFLTAAAWCLKYSGRFGIVYLAERLSELMVAMVAVGIEPKRLRMVHARLGEPAKMVLVEGRKGGAPGLKVEAPLSIYAEEGEPAYSDEVLRIYESEGQANGLG
ncbi:MAG: tRNA1(Val) (adenine(37)-N6)-methyltransferase [Geopsychrobacter sp.]|nr:tRNA1(Val) (adenine(37)-N6)-methyltransferase [Geopsychrobacter sp.]